VLSVALVFRGQFPWPAATILILLIGVGANICYCLGWASEILLQRYFVRHHRHRIGRVLMSLVLGVSLLVVLAPILVVAILVLFGVIP
jgi:putative Mn2+ efflux pump MntP